MQIAIASDGKNVSGSFGHREGFTIFDVNIMLIGTCSKCKEDK